MADQRGSDDTAALQNLVLSAALTGEPLPGGASVRIPELSAVGTSRPIPVLEDNLSPAALRGIPRPVNIVNRSRLVELAGAGSDVTYLSFKPVEHQGDDVTVVLEVGVQRASGPAIVGGVVTQFRRTSTGWVAEPPAAFAT